MTTPTRLVWDLAGSPEPAAASVAKHLTDHPAVCCLCAHHDTRTADVMRALGTNLVDQACYRDQRSSRVCRACLWCCSGKPPATLRMWSIVAAPDQVLPPHHDKAWLGPTPGLHLTNRAAPHAVIDTLTRPPAGDWVVTIATSGQKHVLPYAALNHGRNTWTVRMENTNITSTPDEFTHVLRAAATLRHTGHRADDIAAGTPTLSALQTGDDAHRWKTLAADLAAYTHAPLLDLALWCLTKETIHAHANID